MALKGDITHTVLPNYLALYLSHLQRVCLIRFLKERYSFTTLSKNTELLEACCGWSKSVMSTCAHIANKTQTFNAVLLTTCGSESWQGSFIAGTAPSFSINRCANPPSNWAYKTFSSKSCAALPMTFRNRMKHDDGHVLALALVDYGRFHPSLRHEGPWSEKTFQNLRCIHT